MALTQAQADAAWMDLVSSDPVGVAGLDKVALRAAVAALDTWLANNQVSANAALPEPFKSGATNAQKFLLLALVAMRRAGR